MSDIGKFIKNNRNTAGMSLIVLGKKCGTSDTTIDNIEKGKTKKPNWMLLCKIANALGFHPFEIMREAGYISDKDINPNHLLHGLEKLNKNEIQEIQLFIDFIIYRNNNNELRKEGQL